MYCKTLTLNVLVRVYQKDILFFGVFPEYITLSTISSRRAKVKLFAAFCIATRNKLHELKSYQVNLYAPLLSGNFYHLSCSKLISDWYITWVGTTVADKVIHLQRFTRWLSPIIL